MLAYLASALAVLVSFAIQVACLVLVGWLVLSAMSKVLRGR